MSKSIVRYTVVLHLYKLRYNGDQRTLSGRDERILKSVMRFSCRRICQRIENAIELSIFRDNSDKESPLILCETESELIKAMHSNDLKMLPENCIAVKKLGTLDFDIQQFLNLQQTTNFVFVNA